MSNKIKFCTDEHVSKAVAKGLRRRGVEALTTAEANMIGASDEEHLKKARKEGYVIFTQDVDFLRLGLTVEHCGIVYTPQGADIGKIINGLMLIHGILSSEDMANHIEFLS